MPARPGEDAGDDQTCCIRNSANFCAGPAESNSKSSIRYCGSSTGKRIEEASASERVELFGRAFGLSAREYELVGLLATGSDTRSMAREMSLSEHTIQDHLKSIFAKTGAHDRVTVLSRALGTRLETRG